MSRIAQPAEKVMAVASIYRALWTELDAMPIDRMDSRVQTTMLDIAGRIAMSTDTRDMGIMAPRASSDPPNPDPLMPCDDCGWINGHDPEVEH